MLTLTVTTELEDVNKTLMSVDQALARELRVSFGDEESRWCLRTYSPLKHDPVRWSPSSVASVRCRAGR